MYARKLQGMRFTHRHHLRRVQSRWACRDSRRLGHHRPLFSTLFAAHLLFPSRLPAGFHVCNGLCVPDNALLVGAQCCDAAQCKANMECTGAPSICTCGAGYYRNAGNTCSQCQIPNCQQW